jgi:Lysophospholipase L1 and related esterases
MPHLNESPNSQLHKTCEQPKTRIACIGDSITELSGYPNYAKQALGDSYAVGNFGACGTTVSLDSENPYMRSRAYALAKDFQPDIAIVMLGTNDANSNFYCCQSSFVADYSVLLDAIKRLSSKPKVWVVRPPHVFDETWLNGHVLSIEVIPAVDEVAKQTGLPVIDVYSATDNPKLFFDGVHPNDEGAKIIADVIYHAIIKTKSGSV